MKKCKKLIEPIILGIKNAEYLDYFAADKTNYIAIEMENKSNFKIHEIHLTMKEQNYYYGENDINFLDERTVLLELKDLSEWNGVKDFRIKLGIKSITYSLPNINDITKQYEDA